LWSEYHIRSGLFELLDVICFRVFREEGPENTVIMNSWHAVAAVSAWDATHPTLLAVAESNQKNRKLLSLGWSAIVIASSMDLNH